MLYGLWCSLGGSRVLVFCRVLVLCFRVFWCSVGLVVGAFGALASFREFRSSVHVAVAGFKVSKVSSLCLVS